jgi:hypothetical protein
VKLAELLLEAAERHGSVEPVRRQVMLALLLDGKLERRRDRAASSSGLACYAKVTSAYCLRSDCLRRRFAHG